MPYLLVRLCSRSKEIKALQDCTTLNTIDNSGMFSGLQMSYVTFLLMGFLVKKSYSFSSQWLLIALQYPDSFSQSVT